MGRQTIPGNITKDTPKMLHVEDISAPHDERESVGSSLDVHMHDVNSSKSVSEPLRKGLLSSEEPKDQKTSLLFYDLQGPDHRYTASTRTLEYRGKRYIFPDYTNLTRRKKKTVCCMLRYIFTPPYTNTKQIGVSDSCARIGRMPFHGSLAYRGTSQIL